MSSDSEKLIRLLIVDEGLHQAEIITSALRGAGLHVLTEFAEDAEDMSEVITQKPLDVVLTSLELPDFPLQQVQQLIRECGRHLSVVAMAKEVTDAMRVETIKLGAQDVVNNENLELLSLVIQREADNLKIWRRAVKNETDLHESEKRCQTLLANSKDAVAYVHEGMHIYANEAYLELFGNDEFEELEGIPLIDMVAPEQQNQLKQFLRDFSQQKNQTNELDAKLKHQNGETFEGQLEFSRASYDGEPCTQILIHVGADTSELEEQINFLHQHDIVTGLYNRQYFMEEFQQRIDAAIRGETRSTLLYISIDNFQSVREAVGISGCDILINDIATILKDEAGENHLVCRFGAYSYTLLCTGKKKPDVTTLTQGILKKAEHHISEVGNQSITATCSISIYNIDENSLNNANEIIARSERNLDKLQSSGGNRSELYVPAAGEMSQAEEDGEIAKLIKSAVADNSIQGLFQPIVSIGGASGERYEIFKRIPSKEGYLDESEFMPAAERTQTAKTLDRWAIITGIKQLKLALAGKRKLFVFIPLSSDSIQDATLARWVAARIQSAKIPADHLVFMVQEANAVNQLKAVKNLYKGLKQLHCQFAIDGFGTGLNPFQLVKHIPPDFLRINEAFTENLASNVDNQNSIKHITDQASEIDISCIIPGVIDAGVLSVLWTVGADFVQGNFLQEPGETLNYDFSSMSF